MIQLEYFPLKALFWLLQTLPFVWSERLSRALIHSILFFIPKRRRLMDANLAACFPSWSESERQRIADASLSSLGRGLALFIRIPELAVSGLEAVVETEGLEHYQKALAKGCGAITMTAHY